MLSLGVKYPNINAKLKGMYAKRITEGDLDYIIKQNNLKNAVLLLKLKLEVFKNVDENIDRIEIARLLEKSQLEDTKKIEKLLDKKEKELFQFFYKQYNEEVTIDKTYFEILYDKSKKIKNLKKIIGLKIDLLNILWIYRLKKSYSFEKENIRQLLINKNYKLNHITIDKLLDAKSFDSIKEILSETIYKYVFNDENNIENEIDSFLYNINKKIFETDRVSSAFIYAYLNIVQYENDDIINIIEGIRYNMEKNEIKRRMVR